MKPRSAAALAGTCAGMLGLVVGIAIANYFAGLEERSLRAQLAHKQRQLDNLERAGTRLKAASEALFEKVKADDAARGRAR